MKKLFNHRLGYAMAYHVVVLAAVAVPFLTLTTEITRALYVNVRIQTAVDAACAAAVQAVDIPYFIQTGEVVIDQNEATTFAMREFSATVIISNIQRYSPVLSSVSIIDNTIAQCNGSATMIWFLGGIPPTTINVVSSAEAKARR